MILIENDRMDPYFNLALEAYLLERTDRDALILWRDDPAIVCGCSQNIFAEVDVRAALSAGVTLARRDSGGGTVYHDGGNVNYTIIRAAREGEGYDAFIGPVVSALQRLGVPASMNRLCDIAVDGRKVSGSAQRVGRGRVLHHGTLLYDTDLHRLKALSNGRREGFSRRGMPSKPFPVTNIRPFMPGRPDTLTFLSRLREALCPGMPVCRLSEAENAAVEALARDKYARWAWVFGRSPAFERESAFESRGAQVTARLTVEKGLIRGLALDPPVPGEAELRAFLTGQALTPLTLDRAAALYPDYADLMTRIL